MAELLRTDQQLPVSLTPGTTQGQVATVEGVPEWTSSNEQVATVRPAADGMSAKIVAQGRGKATISLVAKATVDGDERDLRASLEVHVGDEQAQGTRITAGAPEPKA